MAKRGDVGIREKEGFKCSWFCEHRATREPKVAACTLGTLNTDCGKAFSLLRFFVAVGQRNEVPPRTVANSDKKYSQHTTRANVRSNNPVLTLTTASVPRSKPRPSANENNLANSDKKFSQHKTRSNVSSSNPALTLTTASVPHPKPLPSANANHRRSKKKPHPSAAATTADNRLIENGLRNNEMLVPIAASSAELSA